LSNTADVCQLSCTSDKEMWLALLLLT